MTRKLLTLRLILVICVLRSAEPTEAPETKSKYIINEIKNLEKNLLEQCLNETISFTQNGKPNGTQEVPDCSNLKYAKEKTKIFDYIVVGGSESGPVLTSRLSEMSKMTVFFLNPLKPLDECAVPYFHTFMEYMKMDQVLGEPVKNYGQSLKDQRPVIGYKNKYGTIVPISDHIVMHGTRQNFCWNPKYCLETFIKYFKIIEEVKNLKNINPAERGFNGKVPTRLQYVPEMSNIFVKAAKEIGYEIGDYNSCQECVTSLPQIPLDNGRYVDIQEAYLEDLQDRENVVMVFGKPLKIIFEGKRAVGVLFLKEDNLIHEVFARKEVIIASGTLNSPTLLLRSGIGPKNQLDALGIPTIVDNSNVGSKIRDQLVIYPLHVKTNDSSALLGGKILDPKSQEEYVEKQGGAFTTNGFIDSLVIPKDVDGTCSSIMVKLHSAYFLDHGKNTLDIWGIHQNFSKYLENLDPLHTFAILLAIRCKSPGRLELRSSNPCDDPRVILDYWKHPDDLKNAKLAWKVMEDMLNTTSFKSLGIERPGKTLPICDDLDDDKAYEECVLTQYYVSTQHLTGGCPMGEVVDDSMRVLDVPGLRVCDPSVLPDGFLGPTRYLSAALGEMLAEMIKEECGVKIGDCGCVRDDSEDI